MADHTTHNHFDQLAPAALIIGCGYLGKHLAIKLRELRPDITLFGAVRSQDSARKLAGLGVKPLLADVTQPITLAAAQPAMATQTLDAYYMVPPGRAGSHPGPEATINKGITNANKMLGGLDIRKAVLVSSTAVYGQSNGELVNAETSPNPQSERANLLYHGEQLWLNANTRNHVLRLSGIYGPKRIVGLKAVSENAPIVGNANALLNLIHVDDAVQLLLAMMQSQTAGRIELGTDGMPRQRVDYYNMLADLIAAPKPAVLDDQQAAEQLGLNLERLRRASSKRLDNTLTRERTGWSPQHTDLQQSIHEILLAARKPQR